MINIANWKSYKIYELFETEKKGKKYQVPTGASVKKELLICGDTPRITVTNANNGIFDYYACKTKTNNYRIHNNFISVSFLGTVFYHPYAASLDMKVHCLKPLNIQLNKYIGSFLVTVIRETVTSSTYADQISSTILPYIEIVLPSKSDGTPDWLYMESYMRIIEKSVLNRSYILNRFVNENYTNFDVSDWGTFHLYDIFNIDSGTKLDKIKMDTSVEIIDFVGRSNFNNGVTQKVNEIKGLKPFEAGCLTLALGGAYIGSCFVQKNPFYTSQNVVVLIPKKSISFEAKQFIATAIFRESQNNYRAFIKELNSHIKRDFTIKLPVKSDGEPDYDYMTTYMKNISCKTKAVFEYINSSI